MSDIISCPHMTYNGLTEDGNSTKATFTSEGATHSVAVYLNVKDRLLVLEQDGRRVTLDCCQASHLLKYCLETRDIELKTVMEFQRELNTIFVPTSEIAEEDHQFWSKED